MPGIHVFERSKEASVDGRDNPRRCGGSPGDDDEGTSTIPAGVHGSRLAHPTAPGRDDT
jgi:hypothetical protein